MGQDVSIPDPRLRDSWPHAFSVSDVDVMVTRWKNPPLDFCFAFCKGDLAVLLPKATRHYLDFIWSQYAKATDGQLEEVDALAILSMYYVFCNAPLQDKLQGIFALFDFNRNGFLSRDELTILFLAVSQGCAVFLSQTSGGGLSTPTLQDECEKMTTYFFRLLKSTARVKSLAGAISSTSEPSHLGDAQSQPQPSKRHSGDEPVLEVAGSTGYVNSSTSGEPYENVPAASAHAEESEVFIDLVTFQRFVLAEVDRNGDGAVGLDELQHFFSSKISIIPGLQQRDLVFGSPFSPSTGNIPRRAGPIRADDSPATTIPPTASWIRKAVVPNRFRGQSSEPPPQLRCSLTWVYGFSSYGTQNNVAAVRLSPTIRQSSSGKATAAIVYPAGNVCVVLDPSSGSQITHLRGHRNAIRDLAVSADSCLLAACDDLSSTGARVAPQILVWNLVDAVATSQPPTARTAVDRQHAQGSLPKACTPSKSCVTICHPSLMEPFLAVEWHDAGALPSDETPAQLNDRTYLLAAIVQDTTHSVVLFRVCLSGQRSPFKDSAATPAASMMGGNKAPMAVMALSWSIVLRVSTAPQLSARGSARSILSMAFKHKHLLVTGTCGLAAIGALHDSASEENSIVEEGQHPIGEQHAGRTATVESDGVGFRAITWRPGSLRMEMARLSHKRMCDNCDITRAQFVSADAFVLGTAVGSLLCFQFQDGVYVECDGIESAHSQAVTALLYQSDCSPEEHCQHARRLFSAGAEGWVKAWACVYIGMTNDHQRPGLSARAWELQPIVTVNFPLSVPTRLRAADQNCCLDVRIQTLCASSRGLSEYELVCATAGGNIFGVPSPNMQVRHEKKSLFCGRLIGVLDG